MTPAVRLVKIAFLSQAPLRKVIILKPQKRFPNIGHARAAHLVVRHEALK